MIRILAALHLADFYQKHLEVGGLPVLGSAKVSDAALREADGQTLRAPVPIQRIIRTN